MTENRRDILSGLVTLFQTITDLKTVVRHYTDTFDISRYTESQLPLLGISEPAEEDEEELTSMHALVSMGLKFRLYFTSWGYGPASSYETLVKEIRDKAGSDFHVGNTSIAMWIRSISEVMGGMPLYWVDFEAVCKYYLDQTAT